MEWLALGPGKTWSEAAQYLGHCQLCYKGPPIRVSCLRDADIDTKRNPALPWDCSGNPIFCHGFGFFFLACICEEIKKVSKLARNKPSFHSLEGVSIFR